MNFKEVFMKGKVFFVVVLLMCLVCIPVFAADKEITFEQLPANAKSFIKQHFPSEKISWITKDVEHNTDYDVVFESGLKIDFDAHGNWTEVDGESLPLGGSYIPQPIREYLSKNYRNATIEKIDAKRNGYEIELTDGRELVFDKKGSFLRMDD